MPRTVFVSYSRKDSDRIQQAVALLEAGGARVFRDIDDIEFGDDWEEVITRKLQECERVMIFWSANAKASEWVGREYSIALTQQKRMVPVLLDSTPLPPELSRYHALTNFMPKRPAWKKYGGWIVGGAALTVLAGVVSLQTFQRSAPESQATPLVVESVDIAPMAEVARQQRLEPAMRPAPRPVPSMSGESADFVGSAAGEQVILQYQYQTDSAAAAGGIEQSQEGDVPYDPVSPEPPVEQEPLPPVFAWGAGLLSLLLLFLFWFRNRSDAPLRNEAAGKEFVDMVFDEK